MKLTPYVIAAALIAASACSKPAAEETESQAPVPVKVESAMTGSIRGVLHATGIVNPAQLGDSSGVLGDQLNRRANRGVPDFSRRHRLVVSSVWDLPTPAFARRSAFVRRLLKRAMVQSVYRWLEAVE